MMTAVENLHYAIGQLAYAIACADGEVQKQEREKFHNIVLAGLRCQDYSFNVSDIIFHIMDKDKIPARDAYEQAMKQIKTNSHYLSPELKARFIAVMEKVAKAYKPVTLDEELLIEQFKKDIGPIHGDPVYYNSK